MPLTRGFAALALALALSPAWDARMSEAIN
jgi:hypothetical protein